MDLRPPKSAYTEPMHPMTQTMIQSSVVLLRIPVAAFRSRMPIMPFAPV